jgi:hypothetical protein
MMVGEPELANEGKPVSVEGAYGDSCHEGLRSEWHARDLRLLLYQRLLREASWVLNALRSCELEVSGMGVHDYLIPTAADAAATSAAVAKTMTIGQYGTDGWGSGLQCVYFGGAHELLRCMHCVNVR